MKYTAIIFDLFGTLVDSPSLAERAVVLSEIASILGTSYPDFEQEWNNTIIDRDLGNFSDFRANLDFICRKLSLKPDAAQIEQLERIRMEYIRALLKPRAETVEVLSTLKGSGHKIGLISDCSIEVPLLWKTLQLSSFFDAAIFSCVVRIKKPDARIYRMAAERLKVSPEQCLYVGDGGSRELTGASEARMKAIRLSANSENPDAQVIDRDTWNGPSVSSLKELILLVQ